MALTGTDRGTASVDDTAVGGEWPFSPASNFTSGSLAVLCLVYDNNGTGGTDSFSSISDTNANTWTLRQNALQDPGSQDAGTVLRVYTSNQNSGTLTTGDTITVFLDLSGIGDRIQFVYTLMEVDSNTASVPTYVTGASSNGSGTSASITSTSITNTNMIIGVTGIENDGAVTPDSDATNGSWSTHQTSTNTTAGTGNLAQRISSQRKIVTASATQTYNTSFTSSDYCIAWIELTDITTDSLFDPFGTLGIFGI